MIKTAYFPASTHANYKALYQKLLLGNYPEDFDLIRCTRSRTEKAIRISKMCFNPNITTILI